MKGNFKFFVMIVAVLLASTLLLSVCMYAITAGNDKAKQYDLNGSLESVENNVGINNGDTPTTQLELQKKFEIYTLESVTQYEDVNGAWSEHGITFFSEKQAAELKAKRDNGELFTLSYDEILFLINDSINQYFSNDYIILTNALKYGFIISPDSTDSDTIRCYHGDYSEFVAAGRVQYAAAMRQYETMLADICDIITYRIAMLDATFVKLDFYEQGEDKSLWDKSFCLDIGDSKPVLITGKGEESFQLPDGYTQFPPADSMWVKSMSYHDGMKREDYLQSIKDEQEYFDRHILEHMAGNIFNSIVVPQNSLLQVCGATLALYGMDGNDGILFPTLELSSMRPDKVELLKKGASRHLFEDVTEELYPEYDISRPTEKLPMKYYQYGISCDGNGIKAGMCFKELVDTFGIPYISDLSGMTAGCYITEEDKVLYVYFNSDFSVEAVKGFPIP